MVPQLQLPWNSHLIHDTKLALAFNAAASSGLPSAPLVSIFHCPVFPLNIRACDSLKQLQNVEVIEILEEL